MGDTFYTLYGLKNKISRCFFVTKTFVGLFILWWWCGGGGGGGCFLDLATGMSLMRV